MAAPRPSHCIHRQPGSPLECQECASLTSQTGLGKHVPLSTDQEASWAVYQSSRLTKEARAEARDELARMSNACLRRPSAVYSNSAFIAKAANDTPAAGYPYATTIDDSVFAAVAFNQEPGQRMPSNNTCQLQAVPQRNPPQLWQMPGSSQDARRRQAEQQQGLRQQIPPSAIQTRQGQVSNQQGLPPVHQRSQPIRVSQPQPRDGSYGAPVQAARPSQHPEQRTRTLVSRSGKRDGDEDDEDEDEED